MLTDITWKDYLIGVSITISIYYLFVGLRYFYPEIRNLLGSKGKLREGDGIYGRTDNEAVLEEDVQERINAIEAFTDDDFAEVEHLIERIKLALAYSPADKVEKVELLHCFRLMFSEYPSIRNSSLRLSINELVAAECEKYGTATLSQEEVDELWQEAKA
ncbi:hypothetical protein [Sphingobacterium siyangense]|jgi:hypothetical protein|uniref:hypothetical protein n=1 Tax=Sphingobacterium siyangense TaxID=459529 RepID=UPI0019632B08|nr:hypothetical protein [Sphingobacterium siyangense]QRY55572.1 hypothetical protein JVX97_16150 [Sphingobacterium siyangense]